MVRDKGRGRQGGYPCQRLAGWSTLENGVLMAARLFEVCRFLIRRLEFIFNFYSIDLSLSGWMRPDQMNARGGRSTRGVKRARRGWMEEAGGVGVRGRDGICCRRLLSAPRASGVDFCCSRRVALSSQGRPRLTKCQNAFAGRGLQALGRLEKLSDFNGLSVFRSLA